METDTQTEAVERHKAGKFEIWALGISIVIGGQYFSWNAGLAAGFGGYLLCTLLIASAYACLCFCTSELTSALPFAGGAYGLARCTLGYYPGFMVGCCETIEYIAYVALSVVSLANMIVYIIPALENIKPVIWFLFYASALWVHIKGENVFWMTSNVLAIISLLILLIFCFGSLPFVNFADNAIPDGVWFRGGAVGTLSCLPLAAWFFVGVESINMAAGDADDPKKTIPIGQISCVATLLCTAIFVLFVTSSLPPGIEEIQFDLTPFNRGFNRMFATSSQISTILSLPATYATAFGFIFSYGRMMHAMASSRLLPEVFQTTYAKSGAPYVALLVGSALSFILCVMIEWIPFLQSHLFDICILSAFVAYLSQCFGYLSMQTKFQNISRDFRSPVGVAGASWAIMIWLLCVATVIGLRGDVAFVLGTAACVVALLTVYYYGYAKSRQTFSEEERKILFVAHVINFNNTKSKKQKRRPSQSDRGSSLNAVMSSIGMGKSKVVVDLSRLSNVSREESKVSVVREDGEDEKLKDRLNGPPQRGISLAWSNKNGDEQQDDDVMSMRADDAV